MSIGDNIKKWREIRNLKQSELAELINVSDKTVSSWEINRTEPKMGMIEKICVALNCKKTDIVGEETNAEQFAYVSLFSGAGMIQKFTEDSVMYSIVEAVSKMSPEQQELVNNMVGGKKRNKKVILIENPKNRETPTYLSGKAAHNDHADELGEQEKMQEDIANLKRPD